MIYLSVFLVGMLTLFLLFTLSRNDLILLRKDITLSKIFDSVFFFVLAGLFLGRSFYVLYVQNPLLLKPLAFLHIARYPGISLIGIFLGGLIILRVLIRNKIAFPRVLDIFYLSFFPFLSLSLLYAPITHMYYIIIITLLISLALFSILLKVHKEYMLRDGSISLVILLIVSSYTLIREILSTKSTISYITSPFGLLLFTIFLIASICLLFNERILHVTRKKL